MFSKILTRTSTETFSGKTDRLCRALEEADAVEIGVGKDAFRWE